MLSSQFFEGSKIHQNFETFMLYLTILPKFLTQNDFITNLTFRMEDEDLKMVLMEVLIDVIKKHFFIYLQ